MTPLPTDAPASRPVVAQLFNRIVEKGCYPETEAADLFAQILLSIDYLHSLNIVHRDVKPENILFISTDSSDMKLIDFGYAGLLLPDRELTGLCGTPDYVAPEVLTWYEDDDNGTPYGKGSDLWSLGVLLYVILSGCSPFSADEEELLLQQARPPRPPSPPPFPARLTLPTSLPSRPSCYREKVP